MREAASEQGATGAWPTGPTGRPSGRGPVGKGEKVAGWGKKMEVGHGWAERLDGPKVTEKFLFE
jgi:hypothetical protein